MNHNIKKRRYLSKCYRNPFCFRLPHLVGFIKRFVDNYVAERNPSN